MTYTSDDRARLGLRESATFDRATIAAIQRAADTGIYDIRGWGAKRPLPHFDDLLFLGASMSRYPLEGYRERCATDVVLGRLASHAAALLRGKHKATFAPHVDSGDHVIIINADKVALTGQKLEKKMAYRHSGYPGGLKAVAYSELLEKNPVRAVEKAIRGMLPKNSLGRQQLSKLKVYVGAEHPHAAQQPKTYTLDQVAQ